MARYVTNRCWWTQLPRADVINLLIKSQSQARWLVDPENTLSINQSAYLSMSLKFEKSVYNPWYEDYTLTQQGKRIYGTYVVLDNEDYSAVTWITRVQSNNIWAESRENQQCCISVKYRPGSLCAAHIVWSDMIVNAYGW